MNRAFLYAVLLLPGLVQADATNDAFSAGAAFGQGNAAQGINSLGNAGAIPGYTSNPPEAGYYGGVSGGDGGLADKAIVGLEKNNAGQAIIDSGTKNPLPVIDPDAPFITIGKEAESSAGSVFDGTSKQCTETSVNKSTFEKYFCEKDVASVEACARTARVSGHMESTSSTETITIPHENFTFTYDGDVGLSFRFNYPVTGTILNATFTLTAGKRLSSGGFDVSFWGGGTHHNGNSFSLDLPGAAGYQFSGISPDGRMSTGGCPSGVRQFCQQLAQARVSNLYNKTATVSVVLTIQTTVQKWVPEVKYEESCTFDKTSARLIDSMCTVPGGDREITENGETFTVHSDCWEYTDKYVLPVTSPGNCGSLPTDPQCTVVSTSCSDNSDGPCTKNAYTYECQKVYKSTGLVCGGEYFCKSGECSDTDGAGDSGFDVAVAKLAGLASAAEDIKNSQDPIDVRAFTGEAMSCRKAFAGFSNCCKDSGWGQDTGLAACSSEELAVGKAKAKKVTVSVGERCDHKVLGACIQKSQVYCVFGGKLARIIQEQGRRDQLGVSFGSGDAPDCRGISVPELQGINFDLVNFSDFYQDLMDNQKIPESGVMVKQIKDRIASQVQQQTQKSSGAGK